MRFHVLTLFPDMVVQGLNTSIIGRAVENNFIEIHTVNIRDYSADKHGKVDDYPYGGGAGMLMQAQPVYDAWRSVVDKIPETRRRTVYVTPQGKPFDQQLAAELAKEEELVFLCGHYEGIDERVLEEIVTDSVSIGDYVLTGGELPAMVMIDAIARLVPGVLHNDTSAVSESFYNDLLEYPQYSRPEVWHDKAVPEVLLSGDHRKVEAWRLEQSRQRTAKNRPDLYEKYDRKQKLIRQLSQNKRNHIHMMESLAMGKAEILCWEESSVVLWDMQSRLCMILAASQDSLDRMLSLVPDGTEKITITACGNKNLSAEEIREVFSRREGVPQGGNEEYVQFLYTQKVHLPIRHREIQISEWPHAERVPEHFLHGYTEAAAARLCEGKMYAAFLEEKPVGIAGISRTGDIGLLYVDEPFRRRGIASALEAYCINRILEAGRTPFVQIRAGDQAVIALQEKLGLYPSDHYFIIFS